MFSKETRFDQKKSFSPARLTAGLSLVGIGAILLGAGLPHGSAAKKQIASIKPAPKTTKISAHLTYTKDIAPIVYQNCTSCHHTGEVAPFSLANYAEVKRHAETIAAVTQSHYMPPWKSAPDGNQFVGERRLTGTQIATLQKWVAEGEPEGNPADLPPMPRYASGWHLGKPDLEVQPSAPYHLAADGDDVYRCFVVPTNNAKDRYLSGIEVHPGNGHVVHHLIVYLDTTGQARQMAAKAEAQEHNPGYTSFGGIGFTPSGALGGWVPGTDPRQLPKGDGMLLPKGADLVLQIHYHKDGKPETDLTKVGLYYSKTPVDKRVRILPLIYRNLDIPAGDAHYAVQTGMTVPANVHLVSILPHMHLIAHDMTVTAAMPSGTKRTLVNVPDWDFNWQTWYTYKQPVALPAGTKIDMVAHYDNTTNNPRNPNTPPKRVTWGEQTTDEMCIAFLTYTVDAEHLTKGQTVHTDGDFGEAMIQGIVKSMIAQYDTNKDGGLEVNELSALIAAQGQRSGRARALLAGRQASPDQMAQRAMVFLDRNGDGKLDANELMTLVQMLRQRRGGDARQSVGN